MPPAGGPHSLPHRSSSSTLLHRGWMRRHRARWAAAQRQRLAGRSGRLKTAVSGVAPWTQQQLPRDRWGLMRAQALHGLGGRCWVSLDGRMVRGPAEHYMHCTHLSEPALRGRQMLSAPRDAAQRKYQDGHPLGCLMLAHQLHIHALPKAALRTRADQPGPCHL